MRLRRVWALVVAAVTAACLAVPPSAQPPPPASLGTTTGKTFFFVYMVGSDLEGVGPDDTCNPQYGSNNLLQLVHGYQSMTPEERANVEVVVAFGGSRRPGWEGITIADMPALVADSADGRFGNGGDYIVDLPQVNMGEPAILTEILRWVRGQAEEAGADRIVVDFWDHGGALAGYGLPVIRAMGTKAQSPTVEIAKAVVDSLIDSVEHRSSTGKTLAVVDLARLEGVERALAEFSGLLQRDLAHAYRPLLKSSLKTRFYGDITGGRRTTVDLVDYCQQLASRYPAAAPAAEAVKAAVAAAVPYNRQDGSRPNSHGVAIMALANPAILEPAIYNRDSVPLPPWYALMSTVLERGRNDDRRPTIEDLTLIEHQGRPGLHLRVVDDLGVLGVYGVYATRSAPGLPAAITGERMAFALAEMRLKKAAVKGPVLTMGAVLELTGRITVTGGVLDDPAAKP